ncbi:MAG: hypothetical protein WCR72_18020 [Bacteroidota bacterium]
MHDFKFDKDMNKPVCHCEMCEARRAKHAEMDKVALKLADLRRQMVALAPDCAVAVIVMDKKDYEFYMDYTGITRSEFYTMLGFVQSVELQHQDFFFSNK